MSSNTKLQSRYIKFFGFCLCLMPFLAIIAPRALGFFPAVLGFLSFVGHRALLNDWPSLPRFWLFGFASIVCLALSSTLWAYAPDETLERSLKLAGIILGGCLLLASVRCAPRTLIEYFKTLWPWSVVVSGVFLVTEIYFQGPVYHLLHPNIENGFKPASFNRACAFFALCFWSAFYMTGFSEGFQKRVLRALLSIVVLLILLKTDSQTSQVTFIVGLFAYVFFPIFHNNAWKILGLSLVIGLSAAPLIAQILFNSATEYIDGVTWFQQSWASHRLEIWDFVSRRALEQPLFGHGIEATRMITDFDTQRLYHPDSFVLHPHNFAVQIWIEFGALGAAFFSALFALFLTSIKRYSVAEAQRVCLAMFVGALSVALTAYGLWQSWWVGTAFVLGSYGLMSIRSND